MKKYGFIIAVMLAGMTLSPMPTAFPQEGADILLKDISADIESYRNKTVVLRLKLKNVDHIFHTITFYDRKNYDIVFDISGKEKDRQFQKRLLNAHNGMEYIVSFIVRDAGALGYVIGELSDFLPVALGRLPEP